MVNRVLHIAKFSGGGSKQPMRQGLVWPVLVEASIREFGHGFESRIDQVRHLLVIFWLLVAAPPVTATRKRKARGAHNHAAQDERKRQRKAALLLTPQDNTEAGT